MMDQKIIDLYDEYTHTPLDRRVFLARLAQLTRTIVFLKEHLKA